jgi:serine/threonine-protein kinase RsbW
MPGQVTIIIPCLAEYVSVARLAILGVANKLEFSYDEVEDIRLAVGEACGQAIERASEYSAYLASQQQSAEPSNIKIVATVLESVLTVEVIDSIPPAEGEIGLDVASDEGIDYQKLGAVLIEILVDEVDISQSAWGTTVRLVKSATASS